MVTVLSFLSPSTLLPIPVNAYDTFGFSLLLDFHWLVSVLRTSSRRDSLDIDIRKLVGNSGTLWRTGGSHFRVDLSKLGLWLYSVRYTFYDPWLTLCCFYKNGSNSSIWSHSLSFIRNLVHRFTNSWLLTDLFCTIVGMLPYNNIRRYFSLLHDYVKYYVYLELLYKILFLRSVFSDV